jgi:hypothetical protein
LPARGFKSKICIKTVQANNAQLAPHGLMILKENKPSKIRYSKYLKRLFFIILKLWQCIAIRYKAQNMAYAKIVRKNKMKHLKEKFIAATSGTVGLAGGILLGHIPMIGGAFAAAASAAAGAVVAAVGVPVLAGAGVVTASAVATYQLNKRVIQPRRRARKLAKQNKTA